MTARYSQEQSLLAANRGKNDRHLFSRLKAVMVRVLDILGL